MTRIQPDTRRVIALAISQLYRSTYQAPQILLGAVAAGCLHQLQSWVIAQRWVLKDLQQEQPTVPRRSERCEGETLSYKLTITRRCSRRASHFHVRVDSVATGKQKADGLGGKSKEAVAISQSTRADVVGRSEGRDDSHIRHGGTDEKSDIDAVAGQRWSRAFYIGFPR